MSKFLQVIKHGFTKHPIIANSIVYGTLYVGAEFSQQAVTKKVLAKKEESFDKTTLSRYAFYGTVIQGPILTVWYRWLDKKFTGTAYKLVAKKLIVDQFFFTPQLLVIFYVAMSIMEHKNDIFAECRQKFIPTFGISCLFWLPAQSINFLYVPSMLRVAYIGTCSFAWVNILCWIKRQNY